MLFSVEARVSVRLGLGLSLVHYFLGNYFRSIHSMLKRLRLSPLPINKDFSFK